MPKSHSIATRFVRTLSYRPFFNTRLRNLKFIYTLLHEIVKNVRNMTNQSFDLYSTLPVHG